MSTQIRAAEPPRHLNFDFLLETMASDLHLHAIQVATIATIVTTASRPGGDALLRSSRHLLRDNGKAMLLALKYGADLGLAAALVAQLNALYLSAFDAKAALAAVVEGPGGRHSHDRLQTQSAQWRRVAAETLSSLRMFHDAVKSRLSAIYADDARAVCETLRRAAEGDPSLIDAGGALRLPQLRQRRQSPRFAVARTCTIHLASGAVQARIEDLSRDGLGVVCAQPLAEGQQIKITLDDGTQVEATVARARGSSYGLSLHAPLPNYDRLLQRAGTG